MKTWKKTLKPVTDTIDTLNTEVVMMLYHNRANYIFDLGTQTSAGKDLDAYFLRFKITTPGLPVQKNKGVVPHLPEKTLHHEEYNCHHLQI